MSFCLSGCASLCVCVYHRHSIVILCFPVSEHPAASHVSLDNKANHSNVSKTAISPIRRETTSMQDLGRPTLGVIHTLSYHRRSLMRIFWGDGVRDDGGVTFSPALSAADPVSVHPDPCANLWLHDCGQQEMRRGESPRVLMKPL